MGYDPYDVHLHGTGGSNATLQFRCNVGIGFNLDDGSHVPGVPEGEMNYEIIDDPNQQEDFVVKNSIIDDRDSGENDLLIQIFENGQKKGSRGVAYQ